MFRLHRANPILIVLVLLLAAATIPAQSNLRVLQMRLAQAGYYHGPIDGVAGTQTADAVREFQKQYGLPETGRIDDLTRVTLSMITRTPDSETLTSAAVETQVQKSHPTAEMRMKTGAPETIGPVTGHGARVVVPFRIYVEPIHSPVGKTLDPRP